MLLELITGRRPIDKAQYYLDDNIVDWVSLLFRFIIPMFKHLNECSLNVRHSGIGLGLNDK